MAELAYRTRQHASMTSTLSTRGAKASIPDGGSQLWDVISNLWHSETNPDGYVSLGCAENALMHKELHEFLATKSLVDADGKGFTYGDGPFGSKAARSVVSQFLNENFQSLKPVQPEQIMVTNGVSAAIEHCAWSLTNSGDGILLGRPYYRAFLPDIEHRTDAKVVPVAFGASDPLGAGCVSKYEQALLESNEKGVKVRALMLCHPHNPLGRCYSKETIIALMKMCQKHQIHLISDEIYALSVWKNTVDNLDNPPVPFESVLSIDTTGIIDPALVHVLWGMSKDFGANGIRFGVIISQANPDFLASCRAGALYSAPSSLVENAVIKIFSDDAFAKDYIRTNQERLSGAYTHAVTQLKKHGIEHESGVNAAFFLWVNLGKKYRERHSGSDEENKGGINAVIYQKCLDKRIYVVSGNSTGAEEPGWFRLVFTQPADLVEEGIRRLAEAVS